MSFAWKKKTNKQTHSPLSSSCPRWNKQERGAWKQELTQKQRLATMTFNVNLIATPKKVNLNDWKLKDCSRYKMRLQSIQVLAVYLTQTTYVYQAQTASITWFVFVPS